MSAVTFVTIVGWKKVATERMALAAMGDSRAFDTASAMCSSTSPTPWNRSGALIGRALQAVADAQFRHRLHQLVGECVVHGALHQ